LKPFEGATEIVYVAESPAAIRASGGEAETEKSARTILSGAEKV
jgi:hypothetical protein